MSDSHDELAFAIYLQMIQQQKPNPAQSNDLKRIAKDAFLIADAFREALKERE
jgi:hypothetical protein